MDATASLIAIVEASLKVIEYLKDVKKGGHERRRLHDEVLSIYSLFYNLLDSVSDSENIQDNEIYLRPVQALLEPNGIVSQLKSTLEDITAKIHKVSEHKVSKVAQSVLWPFQKEDIKELVGRLERLKSSVTVALSQAHLEQGRIGNLMVSNVNSVVSRQHFREIVEWISPLDFSHIRGSPLKKALSGTGRWFLDGDEFKIYKRGAVPVLWCSGTPGTGKTCLASAAFDNLVSDKDEKTVVLIAFCAFDVPTTHAAKDILWSLLRQLVEIKGMCSKRIDELYTKHMKGQRIQSRPIVDQLCEVLSAELDEFHRSFIVLDGLDEMPSQGEREELLRRLEELDPLPRLMVTSRPLSDISAWFTQVATIDRYRVDPVLAFSSCEVCNSSIRSYYTCEKCKNHVCVTCYADKKNCGTCKNDLELVYSASVVIAAQPEDIEQYVNSRIDHSKALKGLIARGKFFNRGKNLRQEIVIKVREDAQSMFLLARFHMDVIERETSPNGVRRALKNLPRGINETFDMTLDRIELFGDTIKVKRLISYVAYSNNLLTVDALNHALAIEPRDTVLDEDSISYVDDLEPMCAGLIEIGPEPERYVRLAHESIRRYISDSRRAPFLDGACPLAIACLTYLRLSSFDNGASYRQRMDQAYENRKQQYPFLKYASLHWGFHVRACEDNEVVRAKVFALLRSQPHAESVAEVLWEEDHKNGGDKSWAVQKDATAIHIVSYFALAQVAAELIEQGADLDSRDCNGLTALMYAALFNRPKVVSVILDSKKANINSQDKSGRTALAYAAQRGHIRPTEILLKAKANRFISDSEGGPPFLRAIDRNRINIVQLFLDNGVEWTFKDRYGRNALHGAAVNNRASILRLLLETVKKTGKGVQVNEKDNAGNTPLFDAVRCNFRQCAKVLLEFGARPDVVNNRGKMPLLNSLKEYQLRVETIGSNGKLSSRAAARFLNPTAFKLYLDICEPGLPNPLDETDEAAGQTPLQIASERGSIEIVDILLVGGASTWICDQRGWTPLFHAVQRGLLNIISRLIAGGADVNVKDASQRTALDFAIIENWWPERAFLLVTHGANFDHQTTKIINLLSCAAKRGNFTTVKTLVEKGVPYQVKDSNSLTPYEHAKQGKRARIAQFLLEMSLAQVNE